MVPTDIIMPQLGESIAEGTVVKWLIPIGEWVEKDQPLLEVETDKVSLEVPSPATGTLSEILVPEGETVAVGTVLARLESHVESEGVVNKVGGVVVRHLPPPEVGSVHYSPAVRQLAKEHHIDLSRISGTGVDGRVTKKDVLDYIAQHHPPQESGSETEELVPLSSLRKTIAENMVRSRHTAAHVTTVFEADCTRITQYRKARGLTYLPFVVNAVAVSLREAPLLNACWSEDGIILKKDIHIGIAVALDDGLLVPVIRNADQKGLMQLGREITDLAERARTKRLAPEEVQGGTFSITNHGTSGSLWGTPIISLPQVAILGVGAVQKRPVVINEAIAIRDMCYLSLSFDHRVMDGATADGFLTRVKDHLEHHQWEQVL